MGTSVTSASRESDLLTLGPFEGIDATTSPYYVAEALGVDSLNIVPNRKYEGYITAQGRISGIASLLHSTPTGFVKYARQTASTIYIAATTSGGSGGLEQFQLLGVPTPISLPSGVAWSANKPTLFIPYNNWMFATNNTDTPIKIDQSLVTTRWGIIAPLTAPTLAVGAAGVLNGTYFYVVTFGVNGVQESSPGVISAGITVTNQKVNLSAIPTSTDPQVNQRNIYRVGGSQGTFELVTSINDNVTTTFTDNVSDAPINNLGQALILHRDPPQPFFAIEAHKERIWGFGYSGQAVGAQTGVTGTSDLWYSNYAEPWGFDNTNQVIPIGRNQSGDNAVGLATLGSLLICFKTKTIWAIFGDTQSDFLPLKLFDIGCVSRPSIVKGYGFVFWLSESGAYVFDGSTPTNISDGDSQNGGIKRVLDGFSNADLAAAVGFLRDRIYYLSFPTQGLTYGYDLRRGRWHKLGFACNIAIFDLDNLDEVDADRVGVAGQIDEWFQAETDLGINISSSYTSRISDSGSLSAQKRYRHAVLQAPVQPGATATVVVTLNPGPSQIVISRAVNIGIGSPRHLVSLPANALGYEAQMQITVSSSSLTEVQRASLSGWVERENVPLP